MTKDTVNRLPEALIFDFDGTIQDTETPEFRSWEEVYVAHGVQLPLAVWVESIGRGHDTVTFDPYGYLESLADIPVDIPTIRATRRPRFFELLAQEGPRPGVVDWLDAARQQGVPLAVASSSDREWVEGQLVKLGLLPYFALLRTADDVTRTKPDPELYLSACAELGVKPDRCIAVEDSPNGVRGAKSAGLYTIACPNPMTVHLSLDEADRIVTSLAEFSFFEAVACLDKRAGG